MRRLFAGWGSCRLLGNQTFHRYVILVLLLIGVASQSRGNIYQWAYVDPNDPSKGVVQSTTLCPDGKGVFAGPNSESLKGLNLTQAYLVNANLTNSSLHSTRLDNAVLDNANLTSADVQYASLTNASLVNVNLFDANGEFATLTNATLDKANLTSADLQHASLSNASLSQANLTTAQLQYASLTNATLANADLGRATLTNTDLTATNLTNADLTAANLTNTNLTGATVAGTIFTYSNITLPQIYSTASYQTQNLQGIGLGGNNNDMTGFKLSGQNLTNAYFYLVTLTNANLTNANLTNAQFPYCTLTNADLTGANVAGTYLGYTNLAASQLYSTVNYQAHDLQHVAFENDDLTGWDFSGQNLTHARFGYGTLTNANLTGAIVLQATFDVTNLTASQLYSTASYQAQNLQDIGLGGNDMTGWNLSGQNLTGANFTNATLTNANLSGTNLTYALFGSTNLTGADLRGAIGISDTGAITTNTILPDGTIHGLTLSSTSSTLLVRNYGGNIPIRVQKGMALTQSSSLVLELDASPWGSTISFDPKISVTLNGELDLELAAGVDPAGLVGDTYQVFNWTGVSPSGRFASVTNDLPTGYSWDTSQLYTTGNVTLMPEPNTVALLATVAVSLAVFRVRRKGKRLAAN